MAVSRPESQVPDVRVRLAGEQAVAVNEHGDYVLYWMTAFRRTRWNFSLDRAVDWALALDRPLVILEALRTDYRWACDRFHAFAIQGMRDNAADLAATDGVTYHPYVERSRGEGRGLLAELASRACVVVGDDYPCFFLPAQTRAARRVVPCRFELVDSNGLWPMRATDRVFARAFDFRRHLQKELLPHLAETPSANRLKGVRLPTARDLIEPFTTRWPSVDETELDDPASLIEALPIDHSVKAVAREPGGRVAAEERLKRFAAVRLSRYTERNEPEADVASELSPHLHWGHLSAHQVFAEIVEHEHWTPDRVAEKANGSSRGWWGMSEASESFLDELITWREVGFNMASKRTNHARYESLPGWAQATLEEHASDRREHVYTLQDFEQAQTHDDLWNAAQRQLVREGRIHNYLRMLWGKKILHWSESPREALRIMIELNNKYALDGRDPNSYSGIFWVLGRYDRAWGPERPIFGKIRYMTCDNTRRKIRVNDYLKRYAADATRSLF